MKPPRKHYLWGYGQLSKHRKTKFRKAFNRGQQEYLLERQEKLGRIFPNSFFAQAKIEFVSDAFKTASDMNALDEGSDALKNDQNKLDGEERG